MIRSVLTVLTLSAGLCIHRTAAQSDILVRVETEAGVLVLSLDSVHAPVTVTNFLRYVDRGDYDGGTFFRTVTMHNQPNDSIRIEVIQGGVAETHRSREFGPILLETTEHTGLRHVDGSVSMARSSPHSATWSFFICIGDQPDLDFGGRRNPDGQGFAVFGAVTSGSEVIRTIHASPSEGQSLTPPIRILRIARSQQ